MVVLISTHVASMFGTANSIYIDPDKKILHHIHDTYYLVYLPIKIKYKYEINNKSLTIQ